MPRPEDAELVLRQRAERRAEVGNVIAMSIPVVVTTSSRAFMDIMDYLMISRLGLGEAQAAILPSQIIMWSYIILGMGIASMVNTFASQSLGRKQYRDCSSYVWQSLYVALAFGLVALALRPNLPALVAWIGHDPKVQSLELAYTRVALLTVGPTITAYGFGWFFVGVHRPWVTMWTAIEANVVNVAVSFVLIFGHLGFEPMGIAGAAWGTLAAVSYRTIRLGLTLVAPSADRTFHSRSTWRPSWRCMKGLLRIGLPCSFQWLCDVVVWAIFVNILVGTKFGTIHLIATNTAWQYMRLAFLPTIGVGQALTALVGKSIGADDPARAIREARIATLITLVYMGSLSLLYWLKGPELISLFNTDPEVVEIGTTIMMCAAVFQLFDAIGITYSAALRGAGDTFVPSVFFIVSNWVIIVGCGWLVATHYSHLGSLGPWLAASGLIVITGVFLWWRWRSRAWMKIDLFQASIDDGNTIEGDSKEGTAAIPSQT
ncbi:MAG: MATE family efflux transporter [Phycisphaerales bacterium]|nr:MAG: MATE family efflux transporter [Phycisphaerales bacterium]